MGVQPILLLEYSDKLMQQLRDKFHQEQPNLTDTTINHYINRFKQISNSPNVAQKDVTKYTWKELEHIVDMQPQKIKAGKPEVNDAKAIYNKNGFRMYIGDTQKSCIKYGNGYSWCISARGEGSMYKSYRHEEGGTPYFIFDDNRTSEQLPDGKFKDPLHAAVLFVFEYKDDRYGMSRYTLTTANNDGEKSFNYISGVAQVYPFIREIEDLIVTVPIDPNEQKEVDIEKGFNAKLRELAHTYDKLHRENLLQMGIPEYLDGYLKQLPLDYKEITNIGAATMKRLQTLISDKKAGIYLFKCSCNGGEDTEFDTLSQKRFVRHPSEIPQEMERFKKDFIDVCPSLKVDSVTKEVTTPKFYEYLQKVLQIGQEYYHAMQQLQIPK